MSEVGMAWVGMVSTSDEAHAIIDACKAGLLPTVSKRLTQVERRSLIIPGAVFVFSEASGIRRWTDGKSYGPSRVQGSFLCYAEIVGEGCTSDVLIKQSFSTVDSRAHGKMHLISYYTRESLTTLPTALADPTLAPYLRQRRIGQESSRLSQSASVPSNYVSSSSAGPPLSPSCYPSYVPLALQASLSVHSQIAPTHRRTKSSNRWDGVPPPESHIFDSTSPTSSFSSVSSRPSSSTSISWPFAFSPPRHDFEPIGAAASRIPPFDPTRKIQLPPIDVPINSRQLKPDGASNEFDGERVDTARRYSRGPEDRRQLDLFKGF